MDEKVEGLPGNRDSHDDSQHDHGAERNRDAGVFNIPAHRLILEVLARERCEARDFFDARDHVRGGHAFARFREDKREHFPLRRYVFEGAFIGRVDVWLPHEALFGVADSHDARLLVIDLENIADLQREALGFELFHGHLIHHDRVWKAQIFDVSLRHPWWPPDERGAVEPRELNLLERSVR